MVKSTQRVSVLDGGLFHHFSQGNPRGCFLDLNDLGPGTPEDLAREKVPQGGEAATTR